MNKALFLVVSLLALGCSVKKKPVGTQGNPVVQTDMVTDVKVSEKKKFLLRPSTKDFKAHEENTLSYRIVDENLVPLAADYEVTVEYNMPHHPAMGGPWFPRVTRTEAGVYQTTYDISMGGDWLFIFTIKKGGAIVDTVSFWVRDIPENA